MIVFNTPVMESLSIVIVSSEVMWRLEVSDDNQTWTLADNRSTNQPVTYYRRRIASFGSPEAGDGLEVFFLRTSSIWHAPRISITVFIKKKMHTYLTAVFRLIYTRTRMLWHTEPCFVNYTIMIYDIIKTGHLSAPPASTFIAFWRPLQKSYNCIHICIK